MKIQKRKQNQRDKRAVKYALLVVTFSVVAACAFYYLAKDNSDDVAPETKTGSNSSPSSHLDPSAEDRVKNGGSSGQDDGIATGGVIDTGGEGVAAKASDGVKSSSGIITLYTPTASQVITGSVSVAGLSKASPIYYRISDNTHGMIGNGKLAVNDGKFSGKILVSTDASEGTFEVYSFDSNGREVNNISVKVKYK